MNAATDMSVITFDTGKLTNDVHDKLTAVQSGRWAHPASYSMSVGSFSGVKRPGCGFNHPPPSSADVKERVELHLHSPSVLS